MIRAEVLNAGGATARLDGESLDREGCTHGVRPLPLKRLLE